MSEQQSTTTTEAAKASSSASRPPVQLAHEGPVRDGGRGAGARLAGALGHAQDASPASAAALLGRLPGEAAGARRGLVAQLQRERGNAYVGRVLQRKCACEGLSCAKCDASEVPEEKKREVEQMLQRQGEGDLKKMPEEAERALRRSGGGEPLDLATRNEMETRFGQDFDDVRVHADSGAAEAARAVRARAFTMGRDIYFGDGKLDPASEEGRRLIAHELTHVVQQSSGVVDPGAAEIVSDAGFEREADRAADAVVAGDSFRVAGSSPAGVQKAKPKPPPPTLGKDRVLAPKPFVIPGAKLAGPADRETVLGIYKKLAKNHQLVDLHPGRAESTAWPHWNRGRSKEVKDKLPKKLRDGCSPDHVVELQLGGSDDPKNLRLLGRERNSQLGTDIWNNQIRPLKQPGKIIEFTEVEAEAPEGLDECLKFDLPNWKGEQKGEGERRRAGNQVEVQFGGVIATIGYSDNGNVVRGSRGAFSGFELHKIDVTSDEDEPVNGTIDASITSAVKSFIKERKYKVVFIITDGVVSLSPESKKWLVHFDYLSDATLDMDIDATTGMVKGAGKFKPTVPLFNKTDVWLKVEGETFSGGAKFNNTTINLPIPGVSVTECSIEVLLDGGKFSVTGVLAFKLGTFVDARMEAKVDKTGVVLLGTVDFLVPGLDTAQGKITYRERKLSGDIKIGKDKFKLPGVKSANINVHITDTEATGKGEVLLDIPGIKKGTLMFAADKAGNYAITGTAELDIPGVENAIIGLTVANGELQGFARVGLAIPGFESAGAQFELRYVQGLLTGAGTFKFKKGKLSGQVNVALNDKRKLTGSGELAYEVAPNFTAAVSVEVLEDANLKFGAKLRFPDAIKLFDEMKWDKTLFKKELDIPLFAIPVIDVGLIAEVGGSLKASAGIGPGTLGLRAKLAPFDPTQEEQPLDFSAGATLNIPAFAELAFGIYGGVGLSALVAEATGGIKLVASVGLRGALTAEATLSIQNGQISVGGVLELKVQPSLKFEVKAYVSVELDLWLKTIDVYSEEWELASKEWGSGLTFGLRFPVQYVFGQPFDFSVDQIEFIYPDLDVTDVVTALLPF